MNIADLIEMRCAEEARESFWAYRQFINPKLKKGWWQKELARELENFINDFIAGKKPKLVIEAPPQHGKSVQIIDALSYLAGKNPETKMIYTSFSERLGIRANLRMQRIFDSSKFKKVFPDLKINDGTQDKTKSRNREILEFINHEGYFRNTTIRGSITGESLDLGIIDDPIKGREEAESETIRDKTWDWLTDDFLTRFSEDAGLLCILTRWHIDDPIGRLQSIMPDLKILKYPAIAICDEKNRKEGEALFPEHKSLEFLLERKKILGTRSFDALYQQNPTQLEGNLFKDRWLRWYDRLPANCEIYQSWDTAVKDKNINDYSVCTTWGVSNNQFYLIDVFQDKLEAPLLKNEMIKRYEMFRASKIIIEDKASGSTLLQTLRYETQLPLAAYTPKVDKVQRFSLASVAFESERVYFPENKHFCKEVIEQMKAFPNSKNDDIVDSISQFLLWFNDKPKYQIRSLT